MTRKSTYVVRRYYSTVIVRDILERENRRGQKRITDPVLLRKIVLFLADNIGSSISGSSIGNVLVNEGLLENVVYFELLRRGYDVSIGKVDNTEVDFIATKADNKIYVQVTESMTSEDVRARELALLMKIHDNYEKVVLSINPGLDSSYEGIKALNLIDWLMEE